MDKFGRLLAFAATVAVLFTGDGPNAQAQDAENRLAAGSIPMSRNSASWS